MVWVCLAIDWIFTFLIIIAIVFIMIAGYIYLNSGGDAENVRKAKHKLVYAVVAIIVGILAKGVPFMIGNFFGDSLEVVRACL